MTEEQGFYSADIEPDHLNGTAVLARGQVNLANSVHDLRMRLHGLEAMVNRLQVQVAERQESTESAELKRIADALAVIAGCVGRTQSGQRFVRNASPSYAGGQN